LATQWPVDEQVSSTLQSLGLWQAGMQLPVLPPTPQTHGPPGPQTIGLGGAASWMTVQSESVLQGFGGIRQIPQPDGAPPGLHESVDGQSAFELHAVAPSDEPPASAVPFALVEPELHPIAIRTPRVTPKRTPLMFASLRGAAAGCVVRAQPMR
jgi:hypothetical protein